MPYIHVYALPRDAELKARTMSRMTDAMAEELKIGKDQIHVIWHDEPAENIAKGGVTIAESRKKPTP